MNFEMNIGKFTIKMGKTLEKKEDPRPLNFNAPKKEYTYAPLRTALLPTPAQMRQAIITADQDPRPLMDILRKLPVADPHLLSESETRRDALLGFEIDVLPNENLATDKEEIRRCQEIKERLNNTNYPDAIKCAMAGVIYGHSVCLPHWELNQYNQYFPRFEDISFVHFVPKDGHLKMIVDSGNTDVFITIGNNSAIVGFNEPVSIAQRLDQSKGPVLLDIDEDNLLTVISNPFTGVIKNYIGGLMRSGLYLTLLKHYDIMDWAKFNELFGMPLRVGKFDPLMSNEQAIAILKTAVQNLGVDAAAVIDKTTEIEFVDGKAKSSTDSYEHFCQYVETKQSLLLLGQTLSNQVNSKFGSRALGNTYNLVREDKLYSDMLKVIPYMKKIVLKDYFYNYGIPPKGLNPRFTFKTEEGEDLEKLAGVVSRLTSAGLPISKEWAYTTFNVEAPKSDKDTFGGSVNPFGL